MKITGTKYDTMRAAMRAVIERAGGTAAVKAAYADKTPGRMLWDLWHVAERNLRYDDAHPAYAGGHWTRVYPYNPSFDVYSDNVNDQHILTALTKIGKEAGLGV